MRPTRKERLFNQDSLRREIQALTDFSCSNKIEVLNVAGPRESKEPGVYEWTLTMLRFFLNRAVSGVSRSIIHDSLELLAQALSLYLL